MRISLRFVLWTLGLFIPLFFLATGSDLLNFELSAYIPLGTPMTALGLISLQGWLIVALPVQRRTTKAFLFLHKIRYAFVWISMLWIPVGYLLSGNFFFNFTGGGELIFGYEASEWFWMFTYLLVGAPLVFATLWLIVKALDRK